MHHSYFKQFVVLLEPPVIICTPERHSLRPHETSMGHGNYPWLIAITGLQINYGCGRKDEQCSHEAQQSAVPHKLINAMFEPH